LSRGLIIVGKCWPSKRAAISLSIRVSSVLAAEEEDFEKVDEIQEKLLATLKQAQM
jgi:hypothetical protein